MSPLWSVLFPVLPARDSRKPAERFGEMAVAAEEGERVRSSHVAELENFCSNS